jgi:Xaa-Pro aminopeptidase
MAAKALGAAVRQIKRGMTETELAGILDLEMRRCGGQAAFETIVAFGANGSRPHHRPGTKRLRENDAILIDFGVRYNGYCCDITRCLVAGRPKRFYKRVYAAVKEAQDAAIAEIAGGVDARKVDRAARDVLRREDLPVYGHGTGHGLGLEVHEHPRLHEKSTDKLRTGEVVTVEPAVYIPGWSGIRIEDDVLVTDHGCEILTRDCPYQF